ncbi:MAG: hypothetical protein RI925_626 [Pseudomonadota bacterium]
MSAKECKYLYKYRGAKNNDFLNRDLTSIKNNTFFAASREKLNDPYEGMFQQHELYATLTGLQIITRSEEIRKITQQDLPETLDFVNTMGVFSLSNTPLNELMWSHYGDGHHGFCIEYKSDKLISFQDSHSSYFIEVNYQEILPKLRPRHLLTSSEKSEEIVKIMLGTKSIPWHYENEVRLVTQAEGSYLYDFRAVECIYFGLRCKEDTKRKIMQMLAGKNIKYKQIVCIKDSYGLTATDMPDAFQQENSYMINMANIAEGAVDPESTLDVYKPYNDHLKKAAEIVRRTPYCIEVNYVSFSSGSTSENPLIYVRSKVNYNTPCGSIVDHYFTSQEIDNLCRVYKIT